MNRNLVENLSNLSQRFSSKIDIFWREKMMNPGSEEENKYIEYLVKKICLDWEVKLVKTVITI